MMGVIELAGFVISAALAAVIEPEQKSENASTNRERHQRYQNDLAPSQHYQPRAKSNLGMQNKTFMEPRWSVNVSPTSVDSGTLNMGVWCPVTPQPLGYPLGTNQIEAGSA